MKDNNAEPEMNVEGTAPTETTNGLETEANNEAVPQRDMAAEYLDALQRERASFINYRRRVDQEKAEQAQYATANLVKRLLPVVDDFDRAMAAMPEKELKHDKWLHGIELISRKLHTILEQEGVEPIEPLGQPFDPNLHEAVAFEDNSEGGDHTDKVAEVYSKGYKMKDRVIRPAMVKVSRG